MNHAGLSGPEKLENVSWRPVQAAWAATSIAERMRILKRFRHRLASQTDAMVAAISHIPARTLADTLIAEVLPLLDGCRFLERQAQGILGSRRLGRRGLPFWLAGVDSEIQRSPLGKILVIGPANYPLFLPGVQTLQALVAGNAVVWKPGRGGKAVADIFTASICAAGLPPELLRIAEESVEAGQAELNIGADKVVFTGSAEAGQAVMAQLAPLAIPCVMELSGCDAVVVLPTADLARVTAALLFGMRLNGSATCMAPRRVFVVDATGERTRQLTDHLLAEFSLVEGVPLASSAQAALRQLMDSATRNGARVHGKIADVQRPVLIANVDRKMEIARSDLFAPVLMMMEGNGETDILEVLNDCPYALTAAIFGNERDARMMAAKVLAGTVVINDLIVPTADPRVPFGGRKRSGFGTTRGAEGLLEMTAVKVVAVRHGRSTRHFQQTTKHHEELFRGLVLAIHAENWRKRWKGLKRMVFAGRRLAAK